MGCKAGRSCPDAHSPASKGEGPSSSSGLGPQVRDEEELEEVLPEKVSRAILKVPAGAPGVRDARRLSSAIRWAILSAVPRGAPL